MAGLIAHEAAHIMLRNGIVSLVNKKEPNMYVQHLLGNDAAIVANVRANAPVLINKDMPATSSVGNSAISHDEWDNLILGRSPIS